MRKRERVKKKEEMGLGRREVGSFRLLIIKPSTIIGKFLYLASTITL